MTGYEFNDYRQPKLNDPGPWLTWAVPSEFVLRYLLRLSIWLWLIPTLLLGITLAPVGLLIQFLVVDYFTWIQYRNTNTI